MRRFFVWAAALCLASPSAVGAQTYTFLDTAPEGEETHFFVEFEVPEEIEGEPVVEIEVRHASLTPGNVLDFGLDDPNGFRGWGGGNTEPAIVGVDAASRSYVPGPIPPGTWRVVVGKANVATTPAEYEIEIFLRTEPTLAPQPERAPYVEAPALEVGRRWYAGDFHVHSRESGDARPSLDEIADFARARGLDFVVITDHNTHTAADFFADAQARHPDVLFVPGVEFTTYAGHANAIGATEWVNHRIGVEGATIEAAFDAYVDAGAIVSINHPVLELGSACIGCAWGHEVDPERVGAVEIESGDIDTVGFFFVEKSLAFWDELLDAGSRAVAVGGSDDHKAGVDLDGTQSPIGSPTTMVEADELSVSAILAGMRAGRTAVKMGHPDDPLAYVDVDPETRGGRTRLLLRVEGGVPGQYVWLVENGVRVERFTLEQATETIEVEVRPERDSRYRVEVTAGGRPRAVSSHVFVAAAEKKKGGCDAASAGEVPSALALAFVGYALIEARRARRRRA
ncbi:MAG: CehA/McbA family metallohydrolase [Myxococcales bacterium]|nr:CehA/McbA family metallohydrolase [Myxococcales bacterium]